MIEEKTTNEFYLLNNDVIFKNIFNTKERLIKLLESILKIKINDIQTRNTELEKTNKKNKKMILDLVLDTDKGKINVEVNNNSDNYVVKRNLIYFFRLIGMCLKEAEDYEEIKKHTQINLTWGLQKYYEYDIRDRGQIELYIMDEKAHKRRYEEVFRIIEVNMDYYHKMCYNEGMKERDKLLKFLSSRSEKELEENSNGDEFMEKIVEDVKILNADPEIIEQLYVEGEERRVRNTERKLGHIEGLEEGEKIGMTKGMEAGKRENSIEIAKNMLLKDMEVSLISEITGLSIEEVECLK